MIIKSGVNLGDNSEEIVPTHSEDFPYVCMYADLDSHIGQCFPWHWHALFEIDYVKEGEVDFCTSDNIYHLKKGDAIFINSNVLHTVRARDGVSGCKIYAHLFDMHFLSGMYNSIFEQNYFLPVLKCKTLQAAVIRPDSRRRLHMIEQILNALELNEKETFGYEFEIRTELSRFWCMLLEETKEIRSSDKNTSETDANRIKVMIQYIREHYAEKITLTDIAHAASVSGREYTRCFSRWLGLSPMNYLNDYRIRMAAKLLLQTDSSIITISESCGFSSNSYFGKVFHEIMGCTPKEYRRR